MIGGMRAVVDAVSVGTTVDMAMAERVAHGAGVNVPVTDCRNIAVSAGGNMGADRTGKPKQHRCGGENGTEQKTNEKKDFHRLSPAPAS